MSSKSIFEKVREFTNATYGTQDKPVKLSPERVKFIIRMIISESMELATTVTDDYKSFIQNAVDTTDLPKTSISSSTDSAEIINDQADAFIDIIYYLCDTAARHGINLDRLFDCVHQANMSKKFEDGTFHIRSDGKIDKPPSFVPPDTLPIIKDMIENGSWSSNNH